MYETDPGMELEAEMYERMHDAINADQLMASMERAARRNDALRKRGICPHTHRITAKAISRELYGREHPELLSMTDGEELCIEGTAGCHAVIRSTDPAYWGG